MLKEFLSGLPGKIFLSLVLLVGVISLVLYLFAFDNSSVGSIIEKAPRVSTDYKLVSSPIVDNNLSLDKVPSLIPKNLPIEQGAVRIQNSDSSPLQGAQYSKLVYVTNKTLEDVYSENKNFFSKEGWVFGQEIVTKDSFTISGSKPGFVLTLSAYFNSVEKRREVTVSISSEK